MKSDVKAAERGPATELIHAAHADQSAVAPLTTPIYETTTFVFDSAAEVVAPLLKLGVRRFRIELLHDEPPERLCRTVDLYRDLIAGSVSGGEVWTELKAANRVGVTRGTLEQRRNPLAIL